MADKERWITLKSGKRVKLDKDGTVILGFEDFIGKHISKIGEKEKSVLQPYEQPRKKFESYLQENNGDKKKAAKQFFDENLRDKFISTTIAGEKADIHFTGGTWQEFRRNIGKNELKANFLEDIPEVLQHYKDSRELTHPRDDFSKFHYFEKAIEKNINDKPVKAKIYVDVGARQQSEKDYEAYHYRVNKIAEDNKKSDVNAEGHQFTRDKVNEFQKETPSHLLQSDYDENIRPQYEIVNIEIDIPEDEPMNNKKTVIFDSKSKRSFDINGFMHVELSNLTKESVDPYFGYEIVNSEALGFEPDKIYFGYRKGEELKKAAQSFNGLPLCVSTILTARKSPRESTGWAL